MVHSDLGRWRCSWGAERIRLWWWWVLRDEPLRFRRTLLASGEPRCLQGQAQDHAHFVPARRWWVNLRASDVQAQVANRPAEHTRGFVPDPFGRCRSRPRRSHGTRAVSSQTRPGGAAKWPRRSRGTRARFRPRPVRAVPLVAPPVPRNTRAVSSRTPPDGAAKWPRRSRRTRAPLRRPRLYRLPTPPPHFPPPTPLTTSPWAVAAATTPSPLQYRPPSSPRGGGLSAQIHHAHTHAHSQARRSSPPSSAQLDWV